VPKESGQEKPSLAAVVGLPSDFDLEGHSLDEALRKWDELLPAGRAMLFRRPTKFEDLDATLTAVDILAELSTPESVAQTSRNAWMKVGDGVYLLPCGGSSIEPERTAKIICDTLGRYNLELAVGKKLEGAPVCLGEDLARAFTIADRKIADRWPFSRGFTSQRGLWRQERATSNQRDELRQLGISGNVIELVETAGQAWSLIELHRRNHAQTSGQGL
jgi:hypothetical protein